MEVVVKYSTLNSFVRVCLLLDFTLKSLIRKTYYFSALEILKCTAYSRWVFVKERVINSKLGVHIFKIKTLRFWSYISHCIKYTLYEQRQLDKNIPEMMQVLLHKKNKIYITGLWLYKCGCIINRWRNFVS